MATGYVIDWSATAAWVQAVGSVLAIGAAIWIDRGSARRLRTERLDADVQMKFARLLAIAHAVDTLAEVGRLLKQTKYQGDPLELGGGAVRDFRAMQGAIKHYVATPGEVGPNLLGALLLADGIIEEAARPLVTNTFRSQDAIDHYARAFLDRAKALDDLIQQLHGASELTAAIDLVKREAASRRARITRQSVDET